MVRKAVEPEHFVYLLLVRHGPENHFDLYADFDTYEEAKKSAKDISKPVKIIRGRKSTVLRFLKRNKSF